MILSVLLALEFIIKPLCDSDPKKCSECAEVCAPATVARCLPYEYGVTCICNDDAFKKIKPPVLPNPK